MHLSRLPIVDVHVEVLHIAAAMKYAAGRAFLSNERQLCGNV